MGAKLSCVRPSERSQRTKTKHEQSSSGTTITRLCSDEPQIVVSPKNNEVIHSSSIYPSRIPQGFNSTKGDKGAIVTDMLAELNNCDPNEFQTSVAIIKKWIEAVDPPNNFVKGAQLSIPSTPSTPSTPTPELYGTDQFSNYIRSIIPTDEHQQRSLQPADSSASSCSGSDEQIELSVATHPDHTMDELKGTEIESGQPFHGVVSAPVTPELEVAEVPTPSTPELGGVCSLGPEKDVPAETSHHADEELPVLSSNQCLASPSMTEGDVQVEGPRSLEEPDSSEFLGALIMPAESARDMNLVGNTRDIPAGILFAASIDHDSYSLSDLLPCVVDSFPSSDDAQAVDSLALPSSVQRSHHANIGNTQTQLDSLTSASSTDNPQPNVSSEETEEPAITFRNKTEKYLAEKMGLEYVLRHHRLTSICEDKGVKIIQTQADSLSSSWTIVYDGSMSPTQVKDIMKEDEMLKKYVDNVDLFKFDGALVDQLGILHSMSIIDGEVDLAPISSCELYVKVRHKKSHPHNKDEKVSFLCAVLNAHSLYTKQEQDAVVQRTWANYIRVQEDDKRIQDQVAGRFIDTSYFIRLPNLPENTRKCVNLLGSPILSVYRHADELKIATVSSTHYLQDMLLCPLNAKFNEAGIKILQERMKEVPRFTNQGIVKELKPSEPPILVFEQFEQLDGVLLYAGKDACTPCRFVNPPLVNSNPGPSNPLDSLHVRRLTNEMLLNGHCGQLLLVRDRAGLFYLIATLFGRNKFDPDVYQYLSLYHNFEEIKRKHPDYEIDVEMVDISVVRKELYTVKDYYAAVAQSASHSDSAYFTLSPDCLVSTCTLTNY